jgi:hypothetical protein
VVGCAVSAGSAGWWVIAIHEQSSAGPRRVSARADRTMARNILAAGILHTATGARRDSRDYSSRLDHRWSEAAASTYNGQ